VIPDSKAFQVQPVQLERKVRRATQVMLELPEQPEQLAQRVQRVQLEHKVRRALQAQPDQPAQPGRRVHREFRDCKGQPAAMQRFHLA
jgi:hypothetical protein